MTKSMTLKQFLARFPDDDSCLEHLFKVRYGSEPICPKCGQINTFHRLRKLRAYTCNCGHHLHPTAGTIFHDTRTALRTWFHVMFLFTSSRNGVSAKEVQRQTGVTYKTAWRMCNLIRKYMGWVDGDRPLGGPDGAPVEADKAYIGGVDKKGHDDKAVVLGMTERGGEIIMRVIPSKRAFHVEREIETHVLPGSKLYTDDAGAFRHMGDNGYRHETVEHSSGEYVRGVVHTNNIEGFWSNLKRSLAGTYVSVSKKHLQNYLREFEYRWNLRQSPHLMMVALLEGFPKASLRC